MTEQPAGLLLTAPHAQTGDAVLTQLATTGSGPVIAAKRLVLETVYLFYIRNIYGTSLRLDAVKGTPVIWATVISATLAQFAITYIPALQQVFGTESVPLVEGIKVAAIGVVLFFVIELEKQVRLRLRRNRITIVAGVVD